MAAALKPHPRNLLPLRRSGVRINVRVPPKLAKLIDDKVVRFGVSKTSVVTAALMRHFAEDGGLPEVGELMKLARQYLIRVNKG